MNSTFADNQVAITLPGSGGGVVILNQGFEDVADEFINCLFVRNTGAFTGGGAWVEASAPTFQTCTFFGNEPDFQGGGIYNSADAATGLFVNSCILEGNIGGSGGSAQIADASFASSNVSFSNWRGSGSPGVACPTCIDQPSGFATGPGVLPFQDELGFYLDQSPTPSPCIDVGDPALSSDLALAPYATATTDGVAGLADGSLGDVVDMGFHYGGAELPPERSVLTWDLPVDPASGVAQLSISATSTPMTAATLTLTAPPAAPTAGTTTWVISGSIAGTSPGTPFGSIVVPINFDSYSNLLLTGNGIFDTPGAPIAPFDAGTNSVSVQFGSAFASSGALTPLVGISFWHAALVIDDLGLASAVTRGVSLPLEFVLVP
ncbi:MAG: hypothetical protein AAGI22_11195 [Planctomycetota bacterium]